ncbi:MAG TPA: prepilin-type N-terminal cleavage/methylation domain-containing protein [Thermoanaerobaculia bacterium]|nr:prepilin-type N-terminal cleavage/methylation domain-containing protein [Thermoanaerobaculia bacterium]
MTGPEAGGRRRETGERGFTLLELLVVMTIIGILAAIAVPALRDSPKRAREATLRGDLFTFRSVIDQYKGDKGNYPVDLEVLVKDGYIRKIPIDPMTKASDWVLTMEEADQSAPPDDPNAPPQQPGVIDVHSASKEKALDGSLYSDW